MDVCRTSVKASAHITVQRTPLFKTKKSTLLVNQTPAAAALQGEETKLVHYAVLHGVFPFHHLPVRPGQPIPSAAFHPGLAKSTDRPTKPIMRKRKRNHHFCLSHHILRDLLLPGWGLRFGGLWHSAAAAVVPRWILRLLWCECQK